MCDYSKEFLEETTTVWRPFSSSVLSHEDAREITENITGLFSLLSEWENENNKEKDERD